MLLGFRKIHILHFTKIKHDFQIKKYVNLFFISYNKIEKLFLTLDFEKLTYESNNIKYISQVDFHLVFWIMRLKIFYNKIILLSS